jgi:hypothetical protein
MLFLPSFGKLKFAKILKIAMFRKIQRFFLDHSAKNKSPLARFAIFYPL